METELQFFLEAEAPPREGPPPLPLELEPREDVPLLGGLGAGKEKSFFGFLRLRLLLARLSLRLSGRFWSNIRDIPELSPPLPPLRGDWVLLLPAADLEAAGRRLGLVTELDALEMEFCNPFLPKKGPIRRL